MKKRWWRRSVALAAAFTMIFSMGLTSASVRAEGVDNTSADENAATTSGVDTPVKSPKMVTVKFWPRWAGQTIQIEAGTTIERPTEEPERNGFIFVDWFVNDVPFDFSQPITEDVTISAGWKLSPETKTGSFVVKAIAEIERLIDVIEPRTGDEEYDKILKYPDELREVMNMINPCGCKMRGMTAKADFGLRKLVSWWAEDFGKEESVADGGWISYAHKLLKQRTELLLEESSPWIKKYVVSIQTGNLDETEAAGFADSIRPLAALYTDGTNSALDIYTDELERPEWYSNVLGMKYNLNGMGDGGVVSTWMDELKPTQAIGLESRPGHALLYMNEEEIAALPDDYPAKFIASWQLIKDVPYGFRVDLGTLDLGAYASYPYELTFPVQVEVDSDTSYYKYDEGVIAADLMGMELVYDKSELKEVLDTANKLTMTGDDAMAVAEAGTVFTADDVEQADIEAAVVKVNDAIASHMKKDGWTYEADGWFYYQNHALVTAQWLSYEGAWYYLDESGRMANNKWLQLNGIWYYFGDSGAAMQNRWLLDGGTWYYFNDSCAMAANQWVYVNGEWYWATASGAIAQKQWVYRNNRWYYATGSGAIAANQWVYVNGRWYYAQSDGSIAESMWIYVKGVWYWARSDGSVE